MKPESESKRKLLEAAISLISESSYGSVSVDDICARAAVNKGSFYYAFKSKSDLAVAAYERYWQTLQPIFDRVFSPLTPPLQRLEGYCQLLLGEPKNRAWIALGSFWGVPSAHWGSELSTQDENIRLKAGEINGRMVRYIESMIRDLVRDGLVEATDVPELAREVYALVSGALLQAKIENQLHPVERLYAAVSRLLNLRHLTVA